MWEISKRSRGWVPGFSIFLVTSVLIVGLTAPVQAKYLILERSNGKVVYIPLVAVAWTPEGNRYFTVIHDFFNPDLLGHLSRRHVEEIDCQGRRTRTRAHARFTGKRGTGKATLNTDEPTSWRPIRAKDDPMEIARGFLCPA